MNNLMLDALHCRNEARAPIWIMRQAGRYMPEYRALRSKHSFLEMCHNSEIAAEVTMLPIRAFGMDAAILFSDILVVADALGVGLCFEEGAGPIIERPLKSDKDVEALPKIDVCEKLHYVANTIKYLKPQLQVPLLGFSGAPFTVASYMIEGGSSRDLKKTKQWMLREPTSFHKLLKKIADCTIDYLNMQADAGVHALQIFDSWAYVLGHNQFREFSLAYLKYIVDAVRPKKIPIILFCRGSSIFAKQLVEASPSAISLDWQSDLLEMRAHIPISIALQGNMDPDILYGNSATIKREATRLLKGMRNDRGYVFNLGHGILPDISVDAVKTLVDCVKSAP
jgi:uroporphyrinogen decarboxylase